MKHLKLFEDFNEYDFDGAKNNPDRIVVKFAPGGYNKFWDQYVKSTGDYYRGLGENWTYFGSWEDLEEKFSSKGLEMRDGQYYLLYKNYDPKDIKDWVSKGRPEGKLAATFYFLKYSKEAGEIYIVSVYGTEYQYVEANKEYTTDKLKGYPQSTYCRFDKGDVARLVEVGSIDHRGYFEVASVS